VSSINRSRLAPALAYVVALAPFSIDTYLPAIPQIASDFASDIQLVEASIGTFLIGLALGQIIGAPMSDRMGRRPTAFRGLTIFILASLGILVCQSSEQLLALRLVQAIGAGLTMVNVNAVVSDLFAAQDVARMFNTIALILMTAPLIAPAVGAVLLELLGWRSVFAFLTVYGVGAAAITAWLIPETVKREKTSDGIAEIVGTAARSFGLVLSRAPAMGFTLCGGFSAGCIFVYVQDAAFVYMDILGVSPSLFPVVFGANIVTMIGFNRLNRYLLKPYAPHRIVPWGCAIQVSMCAIFLATSLLLEPSLAIVMPLIMFGIGCVTIIIGNCMACFLAYFPKNRGAASGVAGSIQFALGGLLGSVIAIVHDGTLVTTSAGMLLSACISLAFLLGLARKFEAQTAW
jgi:DHA1 family bicyclomycin/chloramphenicol resistance-like MFS transporter